MSSTIKLNNNQGDAITLEHGNTISSLGNRTIPLGNITHKVNSIAELRAMTENPEYVHVTGYYNADDGAFGSHFFKRIVSTGQTDNGGTLIINASGTLYELQYDGAVNVKWFGVTDDGTNQASTLELIFNTNSNVMIDDEFTVDSNISITNVNLRVTGTKKGRLKLGSSIRPSGDAILRFDYTAGIADVEIDNLYFEGTSIPTSVASFISMNWGYSPNFDVSRFKVTNCTFDNPQAYGVVSRSISTQSFDNVNISNNTFIFDSTDAVVGKAGIDFITNAGEINYNGINVSNNNFIYNTTNANHIALKVQGGTNGNITGNKVLNGNLRGSSNSALFELYGGEMVVSGNDWSQHGDVLLSGYRIVYSNNYISEDVFVQPISADFQSACPFSDTKRSSIMSVISNKIVGDLNIFGVNNCLIESNAVEGITRLYSGKIASGGSFATIDYTTDTTEYTVDVAFECNFLINVYIGYNSADATNYGVSGFRMTRNKCLAISGPSGQGQMYTKDSGRELNMYNNTIQSYSVITAHKPTTNQEVIRQTWIGNTIDTRGASTAVNALKNVNNAIVFNNTFIANEHYIATSYLLEYIKHDDTDTSGNKTIFSNNVYDASYASVPLDVVGYITQSGGGFSNGSSGVGNAGTLLLWKEDYKNFINFSTVTETLSSVSGVLRWATGEINVPAGVNGIWDVNIVTMQYDSNAASYTTLGSITGRQAIYNDSGTRIGYIPIYASIS